MCSPLKSKELQRINNLFFEVLEKVPTSDSSGCLLGELSQASTAWSSQDQNRGVIWNGALMLGVLMKKSLIFH